MVEKATAKSCVLVVDDSVTTLTLIERLLEKQYEVITARDGLQAIAALDSQQIDLVITDLQMPNFSGDDLVRLVRSAPGAPRLVIMSANLRSRSYAEVLNLADATLPKPFGVHDLTDLVARLLPTGSSHAPRSQASDRHTRTIV